MPEAQNRPRPHWNDLNLNRVSWNKNRKMKKVARSIEKLEKQVPERVYYALRSAYKSAINSGHVVVISRHGKIVRLGSDLKEHVIGSVPKTVKVGKGTRVKLA